MRELPTVNIFEMMTPWKRSMRVTLGLVDISLVSDMEALHYDQAPAMVDRTSIGLMPLARLHELAAAGMPLTEDDDGLITSNVNGEPDLEEVLDAVEMHGMSSVCIGTLAGDAGFGGFITISDLNKHPFRSALYPLFAELESELATLASLHFSDPWTWIEKLDKDKQARLIGYWELSKRQGVDVGPLAATTLSELSKIIGNAEPLRTKLGFPSRGKWDDFFGGLVDLRNSVMHPVRPLFTSKEDLHKVHEQVTKSLTLLHLFDQDRSE